MQSLTSRIAASSKRSTNLPSLKDLLPRTAHSAIICGQTGCGKNSLRLGSVRRHLPGVFGISWSCAPPYGTTWLITNAPGSGQTLKSSLWTPVSAYTITCEHFTGCLRASQPYTSLTTARPGRPSARRDTCFRSLRSRAASRGRVYGF